MKLRLTIPGFVVLSVLGLLGLMFGAPALFNTRFGVWALVPLFLIVGAIWLLLLIKTLQRVFLRKQINKLLNQKER